MCLHNCYFTNRIARKVLIRRVKPKENEEFTIVSKKAEKDGHVAMMILVSFSIWCKQWINLQYITLFTFRINKVPWASWAGSNFSSIFLSIEPYYKLYQCLTIFTVFLTVSCLKTSMKFMAEIIFIYDMNALLLSICVGVYLSVKRLENPSFHSLFGVSII